MRVQETRIGRLRLHTWDNNRHGARSNVTRQLRQTRLHPAHLPSSAILVIRQLAHGMPFGTDSKRAYQWSQQLRQQVEALSRQAVRPYYQANGHMAQSVLFLDPMELLLCHTEDMLAHKCPWYWQALFDLIPAQPMAEQMIVGWLAHVGALPKMLAQLPVSLSEQVLVQITQRQLRQVITAVHQHFTLDIVALSSQHPVKRKVVTPPWHRWMPPDGIKLTNRLQPLAAYLLGVSHTLAVAPHVVRSQRFISDAIAWIEQQEAVHQMPELSDENKTLNPSQSRKGRDEARTGQADSITHSSARGFALVDDPSGIDETTESNKIAGDHQLPIESEPPESTLSPQHFAETGLQEVPSEIASNVPQQDKVAIGPMGRQHQPESIGDGWVESAEAQNEQEILASSSEQMQDGYPAYIDGIHTELGGAFYLLNLITWLEGDTQWQAEEPTDLWVAIAVLMTELLDERVATYQADPLWSILATLAHCTEDGLWMTLDSQAYQWWRQQYHESIQAKLLQRLTGDKEALADLFCIPAEVVITNTHIDVIMPLDAIHIDIRRSGLDRSPGWLPAFSFIVTFEFR